LGVQAWQEETIERRVEERRSLVIIANELLYSSQFKYNESDDREEVDDVLLESIAGIEDVRYIQVIEGDGSVKKTSLEEERGFDEKLVDVARTALDTDKTQVRDGIIEGERVKKIVHPGKEGQVIVLASSVEDLLKEAKELAYMGYAWVFSTLLFIFFVFIVIFYFSVISPIKKICKEQEKIGRGKLRIDPIKPRGTKEVRSISHSFNRMVRRLRGYQEKMEEQKQVLEIRVNARTKELKELNEELERQVDERTKELKRQVEEYEKANKLMVGREVKMVELKKELKKAKKIIKKLKEENSNYHSKEDEEDKEQKEK